MKKALLAALTVALAAVVASCGENGNAQSTEEGAATEASEAVQEVPQEICRPDDRARVYLTARGMRLFGEGWSHSDTIQTRIDQKLADRLLAPVGGRVGLRVAGESAALSSAPSPSVADSSEDEGKLMRVHVDRPDPDPDHVSPAPADILMLAIYDKLVCEKAAREQRYRCVDCGEVTVCGVNPRCY